MNKEKNLNKVIFSIFIKVSKKSYNILYNLMSYQLNLLSLKIHLNKLEKKYCKNFNILMKYFSKNFIYSLKYTSSKEVLNNLILFYY